MIVLQATSWKNINTFVHVAFIHEAFIHESKIVSNFIIIKELKVKEKTTLWENKENFSTW